jgi:hypothetical protein
VPIEEEEEEKIKTHILCSVTTFKKIVQFTAQPDRPQLTIQFGA